MGFMTREFRLVGFVQFSCLFVLFVHMPRECQDWEVFRKRKKLTYSCYLKEVLKMDIFYCFASRQL